MQAELLEPRGDGVGMVATGRVGVTAAGRGRTAEDEGRRDAGRQQRRRQRRVVRRRRHGIAGVGKPGKTEHA